MAFKIHVMASPKKVLKSFILHCKNFGRLKFRTRKNFGRIYFRTLFWSEIKIVRNFLQVMYHIELGDLCSIKHADHKRLIQGKDDQSQRYRDETH